MAAKQKQAQKKALEKFGLDFEDYTHEDIRMKNVVSAINISTNLAGSGLYSFGQSLQGNSSEVFAMNMQQAQIEQNFILMRQNEEIIRLLKEIAQK